MRRKDRDKHVRCKITSISEECKNTKSFSFMPDKDIDLRPEPGQFGMFYIPGVGENPFSFSENSEITVREVCEEDGQGNSFTNHLFRMQEGNYIFFRGPYGRGFFSKAHADLLLEMPDVIVAGGCGSAPLRLKAKELRAEKMKYNVKSPLTILVGAKTAEELLFVNDFAKYADRVDIFTDDGSRGRKGFVTEGIKDLDIDGEMFFYICGPELMIAEAASEAVKASADPAKVYISLERYMKCGMGLCGSCDCGGYLVCKDGPVFSYDELMDNPHFGSKKRGRSGTLEEL